MQPNPKVSVYQNASPSSFIGNKTVAAVIATVRTAKFKPQTDHLRSGLNADEARIYKAGTKKNEQFIPGHFWAVSWSGELGLQVAHNKGLQVHSGLI